MTPNRIYAPDGPAGPNGTELAPLPPILTDRRIVALDNGKPEAETLLSHMANRLSTRTGAARAEVVRKGSAATPCEALLLDRIRRSADLVLTGTAD